MPTLAEVRRVGGVVWASSPDDAIAKFEASEFDERTTVVLEGPGLSTNVSPGVASLILDAPGELQVRTTGPSQGVLFIARTYRGQTRAWFNGRPVTIYPANVHLIGMILPAGNGVVRVSL